MSQEQATLLGHHCALDIYSDPMAQRKVCRHAAAPVLSTFRLFRRCFCRRLPQGSALERPRGNQTCILRISRVGVNA